MKGKKGSQKGMQRLWAVLEKMCILGAPLGFSRCFQALPLIDFASTQTFFALLKNAHQWPRTLNMAKDLESCCVTFPQFAHPPGEAAQMGRSSQMGSFTELQKAEHCRKQSWICLQESLERFAAHISPITSFLIKVKLVYNIYQFQVYIII